MKPPDRYVDGIPLRLIRRRYGRTTYTWAHIIQANSDRLLWIETDPWPCINPPKAELEEAVRAFVQQHPLSIAGLTVTRQSK
jgi:hypothetical protein